MWVKGGGLFEPQEKCVSFMTISSQPPRTGTVRVEWKTLGLIAACYGLWIAAVFGISAVTLWVSVPVAVFALVLHASLTHEVCHGHPLPSRRASEWLVHFNPGLAFPYLRFRDTHLAHHRDANLTDPYDDPESNYLDPKLWAQMPSWLKAIRGVNNTLAGRILLGPILGQIAFMRQDLNAILAGEQDILRSWALHVPSVIITLALVSQSQMPIWIYLVCCYAALGILKVRTFLEHQAHEKARGRSVIIEDHGILAFLFLNNNLHAVHHMHPNVPWYGLPRLYQTHKTRYQACNDGYVFGSYRQIFGQYLWRRKDPVPHPLMPLGAQDSGKHI